MQVPRIPVQFNGTDPQFLGSTGLPVHALHVISQNDACHVVAAGNGDFERIAFCLVRHGTDQRQTRSVVVDFRTQHQRRPPPGLLVSRLGIEGQPDEIAAGGNIGGDHRDSWPAGGPHSVSECRFFVVIRDTSCRKSYFLRVDRKPILPSVARSSVSRSGPAAIRAFVVSFGIRLLLQLQNHPRIGRHPKRAVACRPRRSAASALHARGRRATRPVSAGQPGSGAFSVRPLAACCKPLARRRARKRRGIHGLR